MEAINEDARSDPLKRSKKKNIYFPIFICASLEEEKKRSLWWCFYSFPDYLLRHETNGNIGGKNARNPHIPNKRTQ